MPEDMRMSDAIEHGGTKINSMMGSATHGAATTTATALASAAKRVHSGADEISRLGHDAGNKIDSSAQYVREHSRKEMLADVSTIVRAHPGKSMVAALTVGVLLGRAFRSL